VNHTSKFQNDKGGTDVYSSNQIFDVTGDLSNLKPILELAIALCCDGDRIFTRQDRPVRLAWKIHENAKLFCVGLGKLEGDPEENLDKGWSHFEHGYDLNEVTRKITEWLDRQSYPESDCDGMTSHGLRCRNLTMNMLPDNGLDEDEEEDDVFNTIACFAPWTAEYQK